MGRHLILACDNCIPGDASGWTLPLASLVVLCLGGAALAWTLANDAARRRALLLRVAGLALLAGPPLAVFVVLGDVTYDRAMCGSALRTSMDRARPGHRLDAIQTGCQAKGERVVTAATAYGAAALGVAAVAGIGALVPAPRRPVAA